MSLPSHGGDVYQMARALGLAPDSIHDFSTNANEFARPLTEALIKETNYPFDRYPDPNSELLCKVIAKHENVSTDKVLVGNGSSELIFLAMQALAPSSVLLIGPIFMEYARACEALNIPYKVLSLPASAGFNFSRNEVHALWNSKADLAILCTPNNPTGVTFENLFAILEVIPCQRILIDNTYREFMWDDGPYEENCWKAYQSFLRPGASLISLNSFTKFFNCAGVRLGYVIGERIFINAMERLRAPWTVSAFAQDMGCKLLNRIDEYRALLPDLRWNRSNMRRELSETGLFIDDLIFEGPSFITLPLRNGLNPIDLKNHLMKWHVLIRVCDNITGMPPGFVRIQVRPDEQCQKLYDGLKTWI